MKKDKRNACPKCGNTKLKKFGFRGKSSRQYICGNEHMFYTGDVIKKCDFKKLNCSCHCHKCKEPQYLKRHKCCSNPVFYEVVKSDKDKLLDKLNIK